MKKSFFVDANVLISGVLWRGNEYELLRQVDTRIINMLTSRYVLEEVSRVLNNYFGFNDIKTLETIEYLMSIMSGLVDANEEEIRKYVDVLDDKKDVPVLAAAIKSNSILITGDKELLKKGKKYVEVMTAGEIIRK